MPGPSQGSGGISPRPSPMAPASGSSGSGAPQLRSGLVSERRTWLYRSHCPRGKPSGRPSKVMVRRLAVHDLQGRRDRHLALQPGISTFELDDLTAPGDQNQLSELPEMRVDVLSPFAAPGLIDVPKQNADFRPAHGLKSCTSAVMPRGPRVCRWLAVGESVRCRSSGRGSGA